MATILDVAKRAGLSKTTVSRVINNQDYVSEENRALVLQAMKELDYHPNPAARRLRGQLTMTIGVLVPSFTDPFFASLTAAIEQTAYENGYKTMICQSSGSKEKEISFLNLLKTKQADGMIITAMENDWNDIQPFTKHGPIVLCDEYIQEPSVPVIKFDQSNGTYLGIQHLIQTGHHKIGYCTGALFAERGKDKERNQGYQKAMAEAGLSINPAWIFVDRYTAEDGKQLLTHMMDMEDRPTGIFTGSDEVAAGILEQANELGIRIPEEMAVIGFGDRPFAEWSHPKLTTIRQPMESMGQKAAQFIIDSLHSGDVIMDPYELPSEIIIRKST
ncbi:LacI family DNA-binding transcriptional regulator [Domibacillus robiginosus]|uniref:LacI family DNA-binding transcriptional regulator n=1 Tax=Domibacillus robiginosus TaxID=1071054 RepID=UPI00067C77DA|nr:LacI family DNA-binding transcriptional regulator [Domibacillus robiginosus]